MLSLGARRVLRGRMPFSPRLSAGASRETEVRLGGGQVEWLSCEIEVRAYNTIFLVHTSSYEQDSDCTSTTCGSDGRFVRRALIERGAPWRPLHGQG